MKKSEVTHDIERIIDRIEALKNANCLSDKQELLIEASESLKAVVSGLSLGMRHSITGHRKQSERCRFCGK